MAKTRVLHVIGGGEVGGAEELVLTLMKLLNPEKYEPCLLCLCEGPFSFLAEKEGFFSVQIPMRNRLDLATVTPVREFLWAHDIKLVHTHGVRANLVGRIAAKREKIPVVTTFHSVLRYDYDSYLKALLAKYLTMLTNSYTHQFIAISGIIQEEIGRMGVPRDKISVIHNGLDTTRFKAAGSPEHIKEMLGLKPDWPTISMIARLHPVKGHQFLLEAAQEMRDNGLNPQFLLVGEGVHRKPIEKMIARLGLQDSVVMTGYYESVEDIYAVSDILCVPSIMEGLGLVILEAMYFGVPVVASKIGGIPEIIEDGVDGLLVPPRDHQALAQALSRLLQNPGLAAEIALKGREKVSQFTMENMARQVEQVYEQVLLSNYRE
ncbi:MAG: glycosyltransferase family 4 protein [Syntrophomonadaceae bacterium]|jgi:glycosyltransferase involved in cell wall biosynthesis